MMTSGLTHPLAEANDGPERAAERTAAAETAAKQPFHVDGKGLFEDGVEPRHGALELLGSHLPAQRGRELVLKLVAQSESEIRS